ncbi:alpha-amlyase [Chryseotalea sanaruensis]|uniref:Alpha-amlyase n=1 Tax=Chryseotalea sanaruensis TaxID=2482724 RepID=A0A401UE10_9BACT|nr:alpha-amylase family glycosyl hydrolase [Chryseotalea sanaruensis]GCC53141.1 alpha-amlyase [Chryseotalea sanaruensis]
MKTLKCNFSLLLIACLLIVSCKPEQKDYTDRQVIFGLASVVILSQDTTNINLEDYVLEPNSIDSISVPASLQFKREGNNLILIGSIPELIGSVSLWVKNQAYEIPLQQSGSFKQNFTYNGIANEVKIKGEFNGWNANQTVLDKRAEVFSGTVSLRPGRYQYLFVVDGKEIRDPNNKDSVDNGMGGWNSVIQLPKPDPAKLPLLSTESFNETSITLQLLNPAEEVKVYWQNFEIDEISKSNEHITLQIPSVAKDIARSFIRVWSANGEGISNDVLIPLENGKVISQATQLKRSDKEAQVLYFMMVDRFNNGNSNNDEPLKDKSVHPKANYFGGDLQGITAKIKDGYFADLGINTLWLSPITQNPKGAYGKYPTPPTTFSAYHGYWPISLKQIDYRFGNAAAFNELLATAHDNNINVILDYVAHHIHQEHPLYKEKPEWFTSLYLPDGSINTERWDDERLTTWFDVFLPTLDLRKPEVVGPMTDTAMYWLQNYALDGFRHDASKHIDLLFWRELTKKIKKHAIANNNQNIYQIGETYGSRELVSSYVNSGMLDGQFDFNVYDDAVATFARDEVPFSRLVNSVQESLDYFGDHHLMGNVTGNQDRARFISYADGSVRFDEDAKLAGWTREINVKDSLAYNKLQSLIGFMMTIPGVPVIYYGDEIGDPGGNDPDNRRMMRFNNLSAQEEKTKILTQHLVKLRRNNLALVYGDWQVIHQNDQQLLIKRKYFADEVWIAFNKSNASTSIEIDNLPAQTTSVLGSELVTNEESATLTLAPHSFEIITAKNK